MLANDRFHKRLEGGVPLAAPHAQLEVAVVDCPDFHRNRHPRLVAMRFSVAGHAEKQENVS